MTTPTHHLAGHSVPGQWPSLSCRMRDHTAPSDREKRGRHIHSRYHARAGSFLSTGSRKHMPGHAYHSRPKMVSPKYDLHLADKLTKRHYLPVGERLAFSGLCVLSSQQLHLSVILFFPSSLSLAAEGFRLHPPSLKHHPLHKELRASTVSEWRKT